jgi:hypothetical protein
MWYFQIVNVIYQFFYWLKSLFDYRDFDIKNRRVLYTIDDSDYDDATYSDFWKRESKKWDDDGQTEYWEIVSEGELDIYLTKPVNVTDIIFYTKYYYNNETYIRMSPNNPVQEWPPSKRRMMCTFPIRSARLVPVDDASDAPPKDITKKIKCYAGPNNDFHNTEIITSKMFNYTEEYLEEVYPTIEIENIIGQKTTIPSYTGTFTHQTLWLPSKISTHQD